MPNTNLTSRIPDIGKPRIIIIGGGFGGMQLVKALAKADAQIVLFDKHNHHCFQPLLYQVATSGLETASIVYPFRKAYSNQKNFYFRFAEVLHITPEANTIETSIGSVHYDYLIIATGATSNFFGMKDIEKHAFPIKTIEDAIQLRNRIIRNFEEALLEEDNEKKNSLIDYVIVGGGPTGVEIAGALAELKKHVFPNDYKELNLFEMDVHLIESAPRVLASMSETNSADAKKALEKLGVQVHVGVSVKEYDGYTATLSNGEKLITRTLVWGAGVAGLPVSGLKPEVMQKGNRILVDTYNRVSGYENIFAVGDVAAMITDETPRGHPMMAPPAMQQGRLLADNLLKIIKGKKDEMKPFKYFDKGSMATIGRNQAVVNIKKFNMSGFLAWMTWMFVHLLFIAGYRNRLMVLMTWMSSYFSYDKSNRLIIGKLGKVPEAAVPEPKAI